MKVNIDKYLHQVDGTWYMGVDLGQQTEDKWDKASLRVLVCFLSNGGLRAVSSTYSTLQSLIKQTDENIFVDYSYFPMTTDFKFLRKKGIPFIFGNVSKRSADEYDLVLFSIPVIYEALNLFYALKNSSIPVYHRDRLKDNAKIEYPLFIGGGISADVSETIHGNGGVLDLMGIGYAEGLIDVILNVVLERRWSVDGVTNPVVKMQMIRTMVGRHKSIYYPDGYDIIYDGMKITKIEKKYTWLPDRVEFNTIDDMTKYPLFRNKVLSPEGKNARGADIMISTGCNNFGMCSFCVSGNEKLWTEDGMVKLSKVPVRKGKKVAVQNLDGCALASAKVNKRYKNTLILRTKRGYTIELTPDHEIESLDVDNSSIVWKQARDIEVGSSLPIKVGSQIFGDYDITLREAEFIGMMVGDGYYNHTLYLCGHIDQKDYIESLLNDIEVSYSVKDYPRNTVRFSIKNSKQVREKYDFAKYNSTGKAIPEIVYKFSRECILYFLKGLYLSDGSLYKNGNVVFHLINESMVRDIQQLFLMTGYPSSMNPVYNHRSGEALGFRDEDFVSHRVFLRTAPSISFLYEINTRAKGTMEGYLSLEQIPLARHILLSLKDDMPVKRRYLISKKRNLPKISVNRNFISYLNSTDKVPDYALREDIIYDEVESTTKSCETVYDLTIDHESHKFLASGFSVHNCHEGCIAGKWQEVPFDTIDDYLREVLKNSAGSCGSLFSFNSNYYSRFFDLLGAVARRFSSFSLITLRADVCAYLPEFFKVAKQLGVMQVSIAIEGLGERVRNKVLNKNLPFKLLYKAVENIISQEPVQIKFPIIITGYETEDDLEDAYNELKQLIEIKKRYGVSTHYNIRMTYLCHYDATPVQWLERRVPIGTAEGKVFLVNFVNRVKELGYRVRFHGSGYQDVFQQALIDGGRLLTDALDRWSDEQWYYASDMPYRIGYRFNKHIRDTTGFDVIDLFKQKRGRDWIFPSALIKRHPDKWDDTWFNSLEKNEMHTCLRTMATPEPKCQGCGVCKTQEEKDLILKRNIESKKSIYEVFNVLYRNQPEIFTRIAFKVGDKYDVMAKKALSYHIARTFLQSSDFLLDNYYSVIADSSRPMTVNDLKDWYSGKAFVDIAWKSRKVLNYLTANIQQVNSKVISGQVTSIVTMVEIPPKPKFTLWEFSLGDSLRRLENGLLAYDGKYFKKSKDKVTTFWETSLDRSKFKINAVTKLGETGIVGVLLAPYDVNPHGLFMKLLNRGLVKIYKNSYLRCVGLYGVETDLCSCGQMRRMDETTRQNSEVCPICSFNGHSKSFQKSRKYDFPVS